MDSKILRSDALVSILADIRRGGNKIVFTNGCFDLIHVGHLRYLAESRALGDCLVVAINTDQSVRRIKGPNRPIYPETERAEILASLEMVDVVTYFDEPSPQQVIDLVQPDILVKGSDWSIDSIIGREIVWARGGRVVNIPLVEGFSTSQMISRILKIRSE